MKLSIIIALYNTEKYIEKCIRSIYLNNTLSLNEFEVIVINDGSTDNSQIIVEDLKNDFTNIILINKENGGQSSARNIGFKIAKGEYIFCLDSDDFIEATNMVEALRYSFEKKLDMLPVFYRRYNEEYHVLGDKKDNYSLIDQPITGGEFLTSFVISGSMWRYFYKVSIIRENNLNLTEGIFHEDEEFIIKFLSYARKISYQRHLVYNHLVRSNSTVNKKDKAHRKRLLNNLLVVIHNLNCHRDNFCKDSLEYIGISKKINQLLVTIFLRMKQDKLNYEEVRDYIKKLRKLKLYPLYVDNLGFKFKIASVLFNNGLFNKLYY